MDKAQIKTRLKWKLQIIVEIVTNRRCKDCKYNNITCKRRDDKGNKCRNNIFPCGFERS